MAESISTVCAGLAVCTWKASRGVHHRYFQDLPHICCCCHDCAGCPTARLEASSAALVWLAKSGTLPLQRPGAGMTLNTCMHGQCNFHNFKKRLAHPIHCCPAVCRPAEAQTTSMAVHCFNEGSINSAWGAGLTTCRSTTGSDCRSRHTRAVQVSSAWCAAVKKPPAAAQSRML